MIRERKIINPIIGILIGIFLIIFGIFGVLILFGTIVSENVLLFMGVLVGGAGATIFAINASRLGSKQLAKKIDESAKLMNPITVITTTGVITKIKDFYIVKFPDYYLHILYMKEKNDYTPSWFRRILGPKLPTIIPLKNAAVTEFLGHPIRRCDGEARIFDAVENRWISGQATMFSIFFFTKSMSELLYPDVFENLILTIELLIWEHR